MTDNKLNNLIKLDFSLSDWIADLDHLNQELATAEDWSVEKLNLMHMVDQIANSNQVPDDVREIAAQLLYKHSSTRKTVERVYGIDPKEVKKWLSGG